jgi:hypothetical protein
MPDSGIPYSFSLIASDYSLSIEYQYVMVLTKNPPARHAAGLGEVLPTH